MENIFQKTLLETNWFPIARTIYVLEAVTFRRYRNGYNWATTAHKFDSTCSSSFTSHRNNAFLKK